MRSGRAPILAAALFLSLGLVPSQCPAEDEHDRARRALTAGEIVPLERIIAQVAAGHEGSVLDVHLDGGRRQGWVYRVRLLAPGGRVTDLAYDARTMAELPADRRHHRDEPEEDD